MSSASSAPEGLAAIRAFRPHVLVSDIAMPHEDGYSLIVKVRSTEGLGRIPAVALTAYASTEDRSRALASGFDSHLAKPMDPVELARVVEALARGTAAGPSRRR